MFEDQTKGAGSEPEDIFAGVEGVQNGGQPPTPPQPSRRAGNFGQVPQNFNQPPAPPSARPAPPPPPMAGRDSRLPPPPMEPPAPPMARPPRRLRWPFVVIIVVVLVAAAAFVGYWAYTKYLAPKTPSNSTQDEPKTTTGRPLLDENLNPSTSTEGKQNAPEEDDVPSSDSAQTQDEPEAQTPEQDSDSDGLSDAMEKQQGTDPKQADSDSDGLYDNEEISIYKTKPLNPDSDGDSYLDGEEVEHGYDPNGSGRLFTVPQQ